MVFLVNPAVTRDLGQLEGRCRAAAAARGMSAAFAAFSVPPGTLGNPAASVDASVQETAAELICAVGGDGTAGMCARVAGERGIPLGLVPLGSANLLARALHLPHGLEEALAVALGGAERTVDLACANGQVCVAMAGMGTDAGVVTATTAGLKHHLGWLGYALAAAGQLGTPVREVQISLDGQPPFRRSASSVVAGNLGSLPGGFPLLPGARLDDGLLDVGVLTPHGWLQWAELGLHLLTGYALERLPRAEVGVPHGHVGDLVEHHRARRVRIEPLGAPLPCQVDGEPLGLKPCLEVEVRPRALTVRIPRSGQARREARVLPD